MPQKVINKLNLIFQAAILLLLIFGQFLGFTSFSLPQAKAQALVHGCPGSNGNWVCAPSSDSSCQNIQSQCAINTCIVMDQSRCGQSITTNPTPNLVPACPDTNGNWLCSSQDDTSCKKVSCAINVCSAIDSSNCGKPITSILNNGNGNATPTASASDKLYNPLPTGALIKEFLIITRLFLETIGVIGVLFIIIGGFQYVIAAGNEEAIVKARKTITWAIIGVVIAVLSFSIISIVQNILGAKVQPLF